MEFKQIEAFCSVVKLGSFSKAAQALGVSQPTISTHISALERELRCELLLRTSKSILPTERGVLLLNYAQQLLSLRQQAVSELSSPDVKHSGSLVIASSSVPAQYCLPGLLAAFSQRYPDISYQLHSVNSSQVIDEVRKGVADIGLTGTKLANANCDFTAFLRDDLVVIAPNTPRFQALGGVFSPELLRTEPFLTREGGSGTRIEFELLLKNYGLTPEDMNIVAEMSFTEGIKKSVISGLGVAIMSIHAVTDEVAAGKLLTFKLDESGMSRSLYLVMRHNRSDMSLAALFFRFALDHYGAEQ